MYTFNLAISNTDSLADSNKDTKLTFTFWKFDRAGSHKKESVDIVTFCEMADSGLVELKNSIG
jgi:hypothetical protein